MHIASSQNIFTHIVSTATMPQSKVQNNDRTQQVTSGDFRWLVFFLKLALFFFSARCKAFASSMGEISALGWRLSMLQLSRTTTKTNACILNLRMWQSHFLANSIETQEMTSWLLQNDRCLEQLHKVYRSMFSIRKLEAEAARSQHSDPPPGCHWTVGPDGENCNVEPFSSKSQETKLWQFHVWHLRPTVGNLRKELQLLDSLPMLHLASHWQEHIGAYPRIKHRMSHRNLTRCFENIQRML